MIETFLGKCSVALPVDTKIFISLTIEGVFLDPDVPDIFWLQGMESIYSPSMRKIENEGKLEKSHFYLPK